MAADLHIHVRTPEITDEVLNIFEHDGVPMSQKDGLTWEKTYNIVAESPNIWIGEVSWIKAALFEDKKTFIPDTVGEISMIVGNGIVLTEDVLGQIKAAFNVDNNTSYEIADKQTVLDFLKNHLGKQIFQVSW